MTEIINKCKCGSTTPQVTRVYVLTYRDMFSLGLNYRRNFGYYSSKEKAEKVMAKIERIQKLSEELDRSFDHWFLDELTSGYDDFKILDIKIN